MTGTIASEKRARFAPAHLARNQFDRLLRPIPILLHLCTSVRRPCYLTIPIDMESLASKSRFGFNLILYLRVEMIGRARRSRATRLLIEAFVLKSASSCPESPRLRSEGDS